MPKLIYVYGDDQLFLDTLTSSLRENGYSLEYTDIRTEGGMTNVTADICLVCKPVAPASRMTLGGLTMDFDGMLAENEDGTAVHFTPTEFAMLSYLMKNFPRAISREELLGAVWNYHDAGTRVADDTVKRLRKKLTVTRLRIETIWGYGFKLCEEGQSI